MAAHIDVDFSAWPLMVVTMPREPVTDDEVLALIEGQRAMLRRREKHAVLADATGMRMAASPRQRRMISEWLAEARPVAEQYTVALALVTDSAILRAGFTAILWLAPLPCPMNVVSTRAEAIDWLRAKLEEAGVTDLARVEALRAREATAARGIADRTAS